MQCGRTSALQSPPPAARTLLPIRPQATLNASIELFGLHREPNYKHPLPAECHARGWTVLDLTGRNGMRPLRIHPRTEGKDTQPLTRGMTGTIIITTRTIIAAAGSDFSSTKAGRQDCISGK